MSVQRQDAGIAFPFFPLQMPWHQGDQESSSSPSLDSQRGWVCLYGFLDLGCKLAEEQAGFEK